MLEVGDWLLGSIPQFLPVVALLCNFLLALNGRSWAKRVTVNWLDMNLSISCDLRFRSTSHFHLQKYQSGCLSQPIWINYIATGPNSSMTTISIYQLHQSNTNSSVTKTAIGDLGSRPRGLVGSPEREHGEQNRYIYKTIYIYTLIYIYKYYIYDIQYFVWSKNIIYYIYKLYWYTIRYTIFCTIKKI